MSDFVLYGSGMIMNERDVTVSWVDPSARLSWARIHGGRLEYYGGNSKSLTQNLIIQASVPPSATSGGTVSRTYSATDSLTRLLTHLFHFQATTFPASVSATPTTPVSSRSVPLSAHKSVDADRLPSIVFRSPAGSIVSPLSMNIPIYNPSKEACFL